jgi:hypothetical protein
MDGNTTGPKWTSTRLTNIRMGLLTSHGRPTPTHAKNIIKRASGRLHIRQIHTNNYGDIYLSLHYHLPLIHAYYRQPTSPSESG